MQDVDLKKYAPGRVPRFIPEVVVIEFREVEQVPEKRHDEKPTDLPEEGPPEREVFMKFPPRGHGKDEPGGKDERRDEPVEKSLDLENA